MLIIKSGKIRFDAKYKISVILNFSFINLLLKMTCCFPVIAV